MNPWPGAPADVGAVDVASSRATGPSHVVGGPPRAPRATVLRRVRSVLLGTALGTAGAADLVMSPLWPGEEDGGAAPWVSFVVLALVAVALFQWLLLLRRETHPRVTIVVTSVVGAVLPISPLAALVALSSAIAHGRLRRPAAATAVVALCVVLCSWRDLRGTTTSTSALRSIFTSVDQPPDAYAPLPLVPTIVLCVVSLAFAVGLGLLRRARLSASSAHSVAAHARRQRDDAVSAASRQSEREQVAREIHDGIGHRLSLLSLEAGALQLEVGDDRRLSESAARLRHQAAEATQELRTLISMLREPTPEPIVTLDHLQKIFDESTAAGQRLSATVSVDDHSSAPATLTRAVHRITTEIVTNARKHAPEEHLRLRVTGGPDRGIDISAGNRVPDPGVPDPADPGAGGGTGLVGICERAQLLGGHVDHGRDGDDFRVEVRLPWHAEAHGSPAPTGF